jgi:hypothetical protein
MKKFYIGCNGDPLAVRYSKDFYELVLSEKGYQFISCGEHHVDILSKVGSRDKVHLEIESRESPANYVLYLMLKTGYKNVSVTLHNLQALHLPTVHKASLWAKGVRRLNAYFGGPNDTATLLDRIQTIYVLSKQQVEPVKKKYRTDKVVYLPYIFSLQEIRERSLQNNNFVLSREDHKDEQVSYFKQLHRQLMDHDQHQKSRSLSEDPYRIIFPQVNADASYSFGPAWVETDSNPGSTHRNVPNEELLEQIRSSTYNYLMDHHSADAVRKFYKD